MDDNYMTAPMKRKVWEQFVASARQEGYTIEVPGELAFRNARNQKVVFRGYDPAVGLIRTSKGDIYFPEWQLEGE
jgi:hypothetical protein